MKILITGTAGFIGFHLTKRLLNEGCSVVGIDNINDYYDVNLKYARLAETGIYATNETCCCGGQNRIYAPIKFEEEITSLTYPKYKFVRLNLEDKESIVNLFKRERFDYVVNLAAQAGVRYSIEKPDTYIQSNIVGFLNILEACRNNPVKHLIYASSSSVYGANAKIPFSEDDTVDNPVSLYAATKKSNELMAHTYSHLYQLPTTGLRFFTVYGPWGRPDMAPNLFANAITQNQPIKVFNNGKLKRDFTYIDDIIEGIFQLLPKPVNKPATNFSANKKGCSDEPCQSEEQYITPPYRILNIGYGSPVNLLSFIETMESAIGQTAKKQMMPMQDGDVINTWADIRKIKSAFAYEPETDIIQGVKGFISWFNNFYRYRLKD